MKKNKLMQVEWDDHFSQQLKQGWTTPNFTPVRVTSVGWKIAETKKVLALAQNHDGTGTYGNTINIMKNCIVKKKLL